MDKDCKKRLVFGDFKRLALREELGQDVEIGHRRSSFDEPIQGLIIRYAEPFLTLSRNGRE